MGFLQYRFSTKDKYGKLKYSVKTIQIEIPTNEYGFTLPTECAKIARENEKGTLNFYKLLWSRTYA